MLTPQGADSDVWGRENTRESQRRVPRIGCRIAVRRGARTVEVGSIRDISLEGAFLVTAEPLALGLVLPIAFALPAAREEIEVSAEVVRSTEEGSGLRFQRISPPAVRLLRAFVAEVHDIEGKRATAQALHGEDRTTRPLTGSLAIHGALARARNAGVEISLFAADRPARCVVQLAGREGAPLWTRPLKGPTFAVGERVIALYTVDFHSYSFESVVAEIEGGDLRLVEPTAIAFTERRGGGGRLAAPGAELVVDCPWLPGGRCSYPILETSESGLSFRAPTEHTVLPVGTTLGALRVRRREGERAVEGATVRYVRLVEPELGGSPYLRVGLQVPNTPAATADDAATGTPTIELSTWVVPYEERVTIPGDAGLLKGILSRTRRGHGRAPILVVVPGYGGRKESFARMATTVLASFAQAGLDISVLRVDLSNNLGESWKAEGSERDGLQTLKHTVSGTVEDIRQTLQWVRALPSVDPARIVLLSASFSAVAARHALLQPWGKGLALWVSWMGAADVRDCILHVSGHVDLVENASRGRKSGVVTVLGTHVDLDGLWDDLLPLGVADMSDSLRDMAILPQDVLWFRGIHDAFMDPVKVAAIMGLGPAGVDRTLVTLPTGHLPRGDTESLQVFGRLATELARRLYEQKISPASPPSARLEAAEKAEWARVRRGDVADRAGYWRDYLLDPTGPGFDILLWSEDYRGFIEDQRRICDVRGRRVLEFGAGTGNLGVALVGDAPVSLHISDLVPAALARAEAKIRARGARLAQAVELDVDGNAWSSLRLLLSGHLPRLSDLASVIPGLDVLVLERLQAHLDVAGWAIVRGGDADALDAVRRCSLAERDAETLRDLRRLSRWASGPPGHDDVVSFETIDPEAVRGGPWPFADEQFDVVTASLVLPYLRRPIEALHEAFRVLRPGGRLVVSSMRRDADGSGVFTRLFERLSSLPEAELPPGMSRAAVLESAGEFLGAASSLFRWEEEGLFRFHTEDELEALVEAAGFRAARSTLSFGMPQQAIIVEATRP